MAKKKVLPDDYNPVRAALQGLRDVENNVTPVVDGSAAIALHPSAVEEPEETPSPENQDTAPILTAQDALFERKDYQLRVRCTKSERKRWNDFAHNITGEANRFSHLFRALLILAEKAEPGLTSQLEQIQALPLPQKSDSLAVAHYEDSLSKILWEAIRRSGKS